MPPVTVGVGYQSQYVIMILVHDDLNRESNTNKNMNDITYSFCHVLVAVIPMPCH